MTTSALTSALTNIKTLALDLKSTFDYIERYPHTVTASQCEDLRRTISSIEYFVLYGAREGWCQPLHPPVKPRVCSQCAAAASHSAAVPGPLFNLANRADVPDDWRCLAHIPSTITFPIGLHGDEWESTGRAPVVWRK